MDLETFILGLMLGLFLDRLWWEIDYNKYEHGLELFEHYHFSLVCLILHVITFSNFFAGLTVALFIAECLQFGCWKKGVWCEDHPFGWKSGHFIESTIIGVTLLVVFFLVFYIFPTSL